MMAHNPGKVEMVRVGYISGKSLQEAAKAAGVSEATARRWKEAAVSRGVDWDRDRENRLVFGEGYEEAARAILSGFMSALTLAVQEAGDVELAPGERVKRLASLGDAFTKVMRELGRMMPVGRRDEIARQVLDDLLAYVGRDMDRARFTEVSQYLVGWLRLQGDVVESGGKSVLYQGLSGPSVTIRG